MQRLDDGDLLAYNITVLPVPPNEFFRHGADPSLDHLNPPSSLPRATPTYLDLATRPSQESFIYNFTAETLKLLEVAQTDVCLLYCPRLVLLIAVEDKTIFNGSDPLPQVIAEAIAVFQANNAKREASGLPPLDAMTIPCITMTGTRPTFYLVPVTRELSEAVILGQYPMNQTKVLNVEGMEDIEYRKLALKRFLAFKTLAKSHGNNF
ncbi:hypothetical protein BDZ97DRAFT_1862361 [Flammula alnicola]|nr:hypothetical protein BDZ97DRAFT_1862361 [Flammula alnicola]